MGGGDSIVPHGTYEGSCSEENSLWLSPHSSLGVGYMILPDANNKIERGSTSLEINRENTHPSRVDFEVNGQIKPGNNPQCCYDELKIHKKDLKREKQKILRYKPGSWIEKVGGLETSDHDVPKTTCLLMVGPSGSGKSSLINRISKVLEDDKFAPPRAQESYNSSYTENGTYFLQEYMVPRYSNSICLYDTRSLSYKLDKDKDENIRMLKGWMTKGVRRGDLVVRKTDNERLRKTLDSKVHNKGYLSSETRKVNFVIYVVNGLLVLKAMKDAGALETQYVETIVSTFNCPFLSFKDDKPVLVFTHGDLLSHTERARVRRHLGRLLGIPPTKQIFDIPDCDCPATASAIIGMLRYSLAHADRNFPQKCKVVDKAHKVSLSVCMIWLILGIGVAIGLTQNTGQVHVPHPKTRVLKSKPIIEWHKIRHIW